MMMRDQSTLFFKNWPSKNMVLGKLFLGTSQAAPRSIIMILLPMLQKCGRCSSRYQNTSIFEDVFSSGFVLSLCDTNLCFRITKSLFERFTLDRFSQLAVPIYWKSTCTEFLAVRKLHQKNPHQKTLNCLDELKCLQHDLKHATWAWPYAKLALILESFLILTWVYCFCILSTTVVGICFPDFEYLKQLISYFLV